MLAGCGRIDFEVTTGEMMNATAADAALDGDTSVRPDGGDAPTGAHDLTAGDNHSCALKGGILFCWGDNSDGQLGLGHLEKRSQATQVGEHEGWLQIENGYTHSCALRSNGTLWCWGGNASGQLGLGDTDQRQVPEQVGADDDWSELEAGHDHTCALRSDGTLWCWGANDESQLGQDGVLGDADAPAPVRVGAESDWTAVSAGAGHTCGVRAPGTLWCWGRNTMGQGGQGSGSPIRLNEPTKVGARTDWASVSAGDDHTCAITTDGSLWCWGANHAMQLGLGDTDQRDEPVQVGTSTDWTLVASDTFNSCAINSDAELYCWGRNLEGQLGLGDTDDRGVPSRVGPDTSWMHVACGRFHNCGQRPDGRVLCAGQNEDGQLGVADLERRVELTRVVFP